MTLFKSVCIQRFSGPHFPAFGLKHQYSVQMQENTDQKNSKTVFTQCDSVIDLVTFTEEFLNGKIYFCAVISDDVIERYKIKTQK